MLTTTSTKLAITGDKENQNGFEFHLAPKKLSKNRGETYIAIELYLNKETSRKIADIIKTVFENEYYKDDPTKPSPVVGSIGPLFETAIQKVNTALATINSEGYAKLTGAAHIIIATIKNTEIHISHSGNVNAFLYRDAQLTNLIEENQPREGNSFFSQTISGSLKNQDTAILTTQEFTNFISIEKIKRTLGRGSGKKAAQEFITILSEINHDAPFNGFFIDFTKKSSKKTPPKPVIKNGPSPTQKPPEPQQQPEQPSPNQHLPELDVKEELIEKPKKSTLPISDYTKKITSLFSIKNQKNTEPTPEEEYKSPEDRAFEEEIKQKTKHLSSQSYIEPIKRDQNAHFFKKTINKIPPKYRKWILLGIIALVVLITIFSIVRTIQAKNQAVEQEQTDQILNELSNKEKKIANLVIQKDFDQAEDQLKSLEGQINELTDAQKNTLEYKDLEKRITQDKEKIFKINRLTPTLVSRISQNLNLSSIFTDNTDLFATSDSKIAIFKYNLENKQFEEYNEESTGINSIRFAEFNENKDTIGILHENGIGEMPYFSLELDSLTSELPKNNSEIIDFVIYDDKIYLLDIANNQVFKHLRTIDGYNEGKEWIQESLDLSNATSFAIDSNIYILNKNGSIIQLTRGFQEDLSLDEVNEPFSENSIIHTTEDLDYLYILDKTNKTLTLFEKDGTLQNQYFLSINEEIIDFEVNAQTKNISILTNENLYETKTQD